MAATAEAILSAGSTRDQSICSIYIVLTRLSTVYNKLNGKLLDAALDIRNLQNTASNIQ